MYKCFLPRDLPPLMNCNSISWFCMDLESPLVRKRVSLNLRLRCPAKYDDASILVMYIQVVDARVKVLGCGGFQASSALKAVAAI